MISWKTEYETGVVLVDTQHKTLFQKINQLERILERPVLDKAEVDGLLGFLESYVVSHFMYEESCMKRFRCPAHEKNKEAHASFLKIWGNFKESYTRQGPTKALLGKFHEFAVKWIQGHICAVDVKLRESCSNRSSAT